MSWSDIRFGLFAGAAVALFGYGAFGATVEAACVGGSIGLAFPIVIAFLNGMAS